MKGEREKTCFLRVKNSFLGVEEFPLKYNGNVFDNRIVKYFISTAKQNKKINDFPDFIFSCGFIEHFEVTSAIENKRKGSEFNRELAKFNRECELEFEKNKSIEFHPNEMNIQTKEFSCIDGSYDNYVKSFKRNWENHIKSLDKYQGSKVIGVFLIETNGVGFSYDNDGLKCKLYKLSLDKNLLQYIYGYKEKIHYVIFVDVDRYEIITVKNILSIVSNLPEIKFEPGRTSYAQINLQLDIDPNTFFNK